MKNKPPKNFLKNYQKGNPNKTVYLELRSGFLRLKYDEDGDISAVHFVKTKGGQVVGAGLEWSGGKTVTFITPMGVSGTQWNNGEVFWGTTYETEDDGPVKGRKIDLEKWIDECLEKMINPRQVSAKDKG